MKQKIVAIILTIMICITSFWNGKIITKAENESQDMDMSYLLTEDALIGYAESQTWGVYYSNGYSVINKISSTKIGAGGATNANVRCEVTVCSIVERKTTTGWARVTSWSQTNENAFTAMVSKSLIVGTGYYYRVRSLHYAETDSSTSNTDALWMGN